MNKKASQIECKQALREQIKIRFSQYTINDLEQKSKMIETKLLNSLEFMQANSILIYLSTQKEVQTENIIRQAHKLNKKVYVPITKEKMHITKLEPNADYILGKYNIKEPKLYFLSDDDKIDLAIVPMVAYDKNAARLGHGKGYFDRFLHNFEGKIIGLAFGFQEAENVFAEAHDIAMHKLITDL